MPTGLDDVHCTKGLVVNSTLWSCGLDYQLLVPHHYACSGNNLVRDHLLQVRPHPTQLLFYTAWERITAQNPPATNDNLGRD